MEFLGSVPYVRDQGKAERNEVLRRISTAILWRRYKQDKKCAASLTGVYIDVHEQGETQATTPYCAVYPPQKKELPLTLDNSLPNHSVVT